MMGAATVADSFTGMGNSKSMLGFQIERIPNRGGIEPNPPANKISRPFDRGLDIYVSSDLLKEDKSPNLLNVSWDESDLIPARGVAPYGVPAGYLFPHRIMLLRDYYNSNPTDGKYARGMVITMRNLYEVFNGVVTQVPPNDVLLRVNDLYEPWRAFGMDDVFYFFSSLNPLRQWTGTGSHSAVPGGYAAWGAMVVNNHIIMARTTTGTIDETRTVRWSQNYKGTISFTGLGSGAQDLADSEGYIVDCIATDPLTGYVFKTDAVVEMRATGNIDAPFEFVTRPGISLRTPRTLCQFNGQIFLMGRDNQIYLFNGSRFDNIGNPVAEEIFEVMNYGEHTAMTVYDPAEREFVLQLSFASTTEWPTYYYCYNVDRRRWRKLKYNNMTAMTIIEHEWTPGALSGRKPTIWIGDRDGHTGIPTEDVTTVFDQQKSFLYDTPDFVAEQSIGEEATLVGIVIGYIALADSFSLKVSVSVDSGTSFLFQENVTLLAAGGAIALNTTQYAYLFPHITAMRFRVRLENNGAYSKIFYIKSINLRLSPIGQARKEAKQ